MRVLDRAKFLSLVAVLWLAHFVAASRADVIASFDLNGITGGQYDSGTQYQTGLSIKYNASLTGWSFSGFNAIHAVQTSPDNWALMVYSGGDPNVYTLNTAFSCNTLGIRYWVSFDIAPTVYVTSGQATRDSDQLRISVLNSLDQAVAFTDVTPGAWNGIEEFHQAYFSYLGDGTGDVRLQITTTNPGSGFFAGAVDNIAFESSQPVPEPKTCTLIGLGGFALVLALRRRRNAVRS